MAFRQYTRCVQPADFVEFSRAVRILAAGIIPGGIAALITAAASGEWWCYLIAAEIFGAASLIAYCRIWLYNRLICLGGDRDVVGVVASVSPPSRNLLDFDWDNDYSINLLLENTPFGVTQETAEQSQPYGELVGPQPGITAIGRQTPGHAAHHGTKPNEVLSYGLHAEFEGAGNKNLLDAATAALAFAIAAFLACMLLPWPIGVMLAALALLAVLMVAIIGKFVQSGTPADTDPDIGELHPVRVDEENNPLPGADIVFIRGTWVYDSLHEGWNEIHPIKVCTKVGTWSGTWSSQPPIFIDRIRARFDEAAAPDTLVNQTLPQHQWTVHPYLDGCAPQIIE